MSNSPLDSMPGWVKAFVWFGAPMIFATYFALKDVGYIGTNGVQREHRVMISVLERICVRLSDTDHDRSDCMR